MAMVLISVHIFLHTSLWILMNQETENSRYFHNHFYVVNEYPTPQPPPQCASMWIQETKRYTVILMSTLYLN